MQRSVKVMVVGQENVGKSALATSLRAWFSMPAAKRLPLEGAKAAKAFRRTLEGSQALLQETTVGVAHDDLEVVLTTDQPPVTLRVWDCGGLELFQATHSLFLTERTVYVVVWNITADTNASRVPFWINNIRYYAPKSKILLVATHLDRIPSKKQKDTINLIKEDILAAYPPKKYRNIAGIHAVDLSGGERFLDFTRALMGVIETENYLNETLSPEALTLSEGFNSLRDYFRQSWRNCTPTITKKFLDEFADKLNVPKEKLKGCITELENLGLVCNFDNTPQMKRKLIRNLTRTLIAKGEGVSPLLKEGNYMSIVADPTEAVDAETVLPDEPGDIYQEKFFGKPHLNFVGLEVNEKDYFVMSVLLNDDAAAMDFTCLKSHRKGSELFSLTVSEVKKKRLGDELALALSSREGLVVSQVSDQESFPAALLQLEQNFPQAISGMKVGVVFCDRYQNKTQDMLKNTKALIRKPFWNWMKLMGSEIDLSTWEGYRGDLPQSGSTYHSKFRQTDVIYHCAPLLDAEGHRRLIGNDIALIFFLEEGAAHFDPSTIDDLGTVPQIYVVVQPTKGKYRVAFFRKPNIKEFGPQSPSASLTGEEMKNLLLTKIYNGLKMTRMCPPMDRMFFVPRAAGLNGLVSPFETKKSKLKRKDMDKEKQRQSNSGHSSRDIATVSNQLAETLLGGSAPLDCSDGFVVLEPEWLTQMLATIVTQQNNAFDGILPIKTLRTTLWSLSDTNVQDGLLNLLESIQIAYRQDEDTLIIPSLLPETLPGLQNLWPAHNPFVFTFSRLHRFSFFPPGLFPRLIVRLCELPYPTTYWNHGVVVDARREVEASICKIEYHPKTTSISIQARGHSEMHDPTVLFSTVVELFDAILTNNFGIRSSVFFPCPACSSKTVNPTMFAYSAIEHAVGLSETTMICEKDPDDIHEVPIYHLAPDIAMTDFAGKRIDVENDVEVGKEVGRGAFATVYLATFDQKPAALKKLKVPKKKDTMIKEYIAAQREFRREVRMMSRIAHPNHVKLLGFSLKEPMAMVMEFIPHGDLYGLIHDESATIDWNYRLRVANDLAQGLNYIHTLDPPLVHRDFKSPNIMITSLDFDAASVAKIADFGLTRELLTEDFRGESAAARDVTNPTWLSPEILSSKPNGLPADVYAFGIVLWEMLTRKQPFGDVNSMIDMEESIIAGKRPPIPRSCPESYNLLMRACWEQDPEVRPTFRQVLGLLTPIIKKLTPKLEVVLRQVVLTGSNLRRRSGSLQSLATSSKPRRVTNQFDIESLSLAIEPVAISSPGFVKHASKTLSARWNPMGNKEEAVVAKRASKKKKKPKATKTISLLQVERNIFCIPFPNEIPDWTNFYRYIQNNLAGRYRIFNISQSSYDYHLFDGVVMEFPLHDDTPPPFDVLVDCVQEMLAWTNSVESDKAGGVTLFHCEGKGRARSTLVGACALILASKGNLNATKALASVSSSIHSSRLPPGLERYIGYYAKFVPLHLKQQLPVPRRMYLHKLRFTSIPSFKRGGGCDPTFLVQQGRHKVFYTKNLKGRKGEKSVEFFTKDLVVDRDINVTFFHKSLKKRMFSFAFNTLYENFVREGSIYKSVFQLGDLDGVSSKHFHKSFEVEAYFLEDEHIAVTRTASREIRQELAAKGTARAILGVKTTLSQASQSRRKEKRQALSSSSFTLPTNFFHSVSTDSVHEPCAACHRAVTPTDVTFEIMLGVVVHVECLACGTCGRDLKGADESAVLRSSVVLCSDCDNELHAPCVHCGEKIDGVPVVHGDLAWHAHHVFCQMCEDVVPVASVQFVNDLPVCKNCEEVVKPKPVLPLPVLSADGEEIKSIILSPYPTEQLEEYLKKQKKDHLFKFFLECEARQTKLEMDRAVDSTRIRKTYIEQKPSSKNTFPSEFAETVRPYLSDFPESKEHFDKVVVLVLNAMGEELENYMGSPQFAAYMDAVINFPDPEEEEDSMRRKLAEQFIPINPADISDSEKNREKAKKNDDEAERRRLAELERLRLLELERLRLLELERLRLEEEERRRLAELERLRLEEEERLRREEEERLRRLAEEAERARLAELERLRLAELERLRLLAEEEERLRLAELERLRLLEEERRRKKQLRRERKAKEEKLRIEREEWVAEQKALEIARKEEAERKLLEKMPDCGVCGKKILPGGLQLQPMGKRIHLECFRCVQCGKSLEGLPFIIDGDQFWCNEDYATLTAVKCGECGEGILEDDPSFQKDGKLIHSRCLSCSICGKSVADGYMLVGGLITCRECPMKVSSQT